MKQNKKLVYILLPIACGIWGYISFQIYSRFNSQEESPKLVNQNKEIKNTQFLTDTISLLLNYKDPFLKGLEIGHKTEKRSYRLIFPKKGESNTIISNKSEFKQWPIIFYNGLIENRANKRKIAVLQINGIDLFLKENESKDGLRIIKILKDSIQLEFQNSIKYIKRVK